MLLLKRLNEAYSQATCQPVKPLVRARLRMAVNKPYCLKPPRTSKRIETALLSVRIVNTRLEPPRTLKLLFVVGRGVVGGRVVLPRPAGVLDPLPRPGGWRA